MKNVLIAGLGNPGKKYEKTRHNAGFALVDYFWEKFRENFGFSDWEEKKKLRSLVLIGKTENAKIILLKPQTFMNLSGEAVSAALKYYKISCRGETSTDLVVVHDEIDLPLGIFRFSKDSSSAGHKGAQSVIDALGTQNFTRLRIGVDNRLALREERDKLAPTEKYVLGKFSDTEFASLRKTLEEASTELLKHIS